MSVSVMQAIACLERGSKPAADPALPHGKALERVHLQNKLMDLLKPYVCSMSHVDIVFGHEGSGKSDQVKQACRKLEGGTLYVDLEGSDRLGSQIFAAVTGKCSRGLIQRFRDSLNGSHYLIVRQTAVACKGCVEKTNFLDGMISMLQGRKTL